MIAQPSRLIKRQAPEALIFREKIKKTVDKPAFQWYNIKARAMSRTR